MSQSHNQLKKAIPRTRRLNLDKKPLLIGVCTGISLCIVAVFASGIFYFKAPQKPADQIIVETISDPAPKILLSPTPKPSPHHS